MKRKLTKLLIFASVGAISQTGQIAIAADAQLKARTQDASVEFRGDIDQPAGAGFEQSAYHLSQLKRASDLIGTDVVNEQDEKIGAIKDLMIDLPSGRAPFAIVSSGGFFGVGDRMIPVPTATFGQMTDKDSLVWNMDKERLKSAPSFDAKQWPDATDQTWSSEVYSFYGEEPRWESSSPAYTTRTQINEPAGAEVSVRTERDSGQIYSEAYGETEAGLHPDRRPRQGLGAEDLTRNEQRIHNPDGYAATDVFIHEPAGAELTKKDKSTVATIEQRERTGSNIRTSHMDNPKRASELIGMEVKNAQNERIGDIKDLVVDLKSGRVAYAVLEAGGLFELDKLYAVPPSVFTRSADERWLVFNTDKETLKTAPSFEKNNWPQVNDQKFTTEVYRFYHQRPYWQTSGEIQEPSGTQQKMKLHRRDGRDSADDQGNYNQQLEQGEIQEPSGAVPSSLPSRVEVEAEVQSEPERYESRPVGSPKALEQSESSAAKETLELQSSRNDQVVEPAGATTESTARATSEAQVPNETDRQLSKQIRTALETDTVLSKTAQEVKVTTVNGRITLRGTVSNEQEKQAIAAKAQQIVGSADKVDNQLRVKSGSDSSTP